jgi:hypothetical protein
MKFSLQSPPPAVAKFALWLRRQCKIFIDNWIPELTLFEDTIGAGMTHLLGSAVRFGIADILEGGPLTAAQLAEHCQLDSDSLHRALRVLVYKGYFKLDKSGRFSNNRMSRTLLSNRADQSTQFVRYFSSTSNLTAWTNIDSVLQTGDNGFVQAYGKSVWQWFSEHPEEEACFAGAMSGRTYADAPFIASAYPFGEVQTVCDVGGGSGGLLAAILGSHGHLKATLVDLPGVVEKAQQKLGSSPIGARVQLHPGDIFQELPAGNDLYLLKNILHDWTDADCKRILDNCRAAVGNSGRILVAEFTPATNEAHDMGVVTDVQMMVVTDNGRERSIEEFSTLFRNSGFSLARVLPTPSLTLLEARPI